MFVVIVYLLFLESDRGFLIFSLILFFFLTLYYIEPILNRVIKCGACIIPIMILFVYLGYYLFVNLIHYILNLDLINFTNLIIYYILVETLFTFILI